MSDSLLFPPDSVKGMTKLDKSKFEKVIRAPFVSVQNSHLEDISTLLKPYFLLLDNFKCVVEESDRPQSKAIILNPDLIKKFDDIPENVRNALQQINVTDLNYKQISLKFENYKRGDIFKAVLPFDGTRVTGHSIIGHIIQLNLREHLLPFKHLIGEIFLATSKSDIKRIVNKSQIIDSEFRFFEMETLAERPEAKDLGTIVELSEHENKFKFDFAKVYWNPRLSTEHKRIVSKIKRFDVLYDMFAGVGPFAIPVAKKKSCQVLANDLNPECYRWLLENIKLNKCGDNIKAYNMDGRDFVQSVVKNHFIEQCKTLLAKQEYSQIPTFHVTMNLPAIAIEFLDAFEELVDEDEVGDLPKNLLLPKIHLYCFLQDLENAEAIVVKMIEDALKCKLNEIEEIKEVRSVAPNKLMFRTSFSLPENVFFAARNVNKRQKIV
ncbi:tRNA (guanine(37)-N1)-methyltransferase-like protein [Dinothrombium tinctorium]|uniref:tRNA (guanine(37)-N1)-methyltransferase n=1 Tax=Dinothrombium tinctorium TaxID=1965070 RepID=A0A3S3PG31_9ACAR|nr:tRNA (guanine(37)-N1)-methyltransferase-like protein [Dinothrombium tinctorium]RWS11716.1 tRNA (guanine(37)-N1)-methyltransferase-like protein [Dinothrombium tinctorium]